MFLKEKEMGALEHEYVPPVKANVSTLPRQTPAQIAIRHEWGTTHIQC